MDRTIVEETGFEFFGIPSGKFRRYFSLRNVSDIARIIAGFFAARRLLKKEKPALLFSKGGFVSVPPVAAAASLNIPVFGHESDFTPGLASRLNLRFVEKFFIAYKESAVFYAAKWKDKLEVSGNPVRPLFRSADASKGRAFLKVKEGEPILLVLGGSSGSLEVNRIVQESRSGLTRHYTVVHQTGSNDEGNFASTEKYKPYAYFKDELPHVIAAAEIVVCRGGAGTIWECAALGKPMVIIPLQGTGTRGDQVENARLFEEAGAAIALSDDPADLRSVSEKLIRIVEELGSNEQKRNAMAASGISRTGAAEFIAETIEKRLQKP